MPVSPLKQREIAVSREASFGAGADFDAITNGGKFYATEISAELVEPKTENENLRLRASDKFAGIFMPKTATLSFSTYHYGTSLNALDQAQAARLVRDELLLNALQGETRTYRAALSGGTVLVPTVEDGAGSDLQPAHSWGFFYDTTAGVGYARKIETVTVPGGGTDNSLVMRAGHDLPFDPVGGGVMHATCTHFPHWDLLEDHTAAQVTSSFFVRGKHPAHLHEVQGVRLGVEVGEISAGTPSMLMYEGVGVDFTNPERYVAGHPDPLTVPTLAGTPEGLPPSVPGRGTATRCFIADVGATLATQQFWGSISVSLGIAPDPSEGPNGRNGVHGFGVTAESYDGGGVELMVPREAYWKRNYRDESEKHMLIQIGDQPSNTWWIYFPRLSFRTEPTDGDHRGRDAYSLAFDALEPDIDVSALTTEAGHRARAKFEIGRVG